MREYQSKYAGLFQDYVRYREISEKWNPREDALTASFDKFCVKYQAHFTLQELAETWCQKRNTESGNSWINRVCMINSFFRYLNTHGLARCSLLDMPKYERTAYIPHALLPATACRVLPEHSLRESRLWSFQLFSAYFIAAVCVPVRPDY